MNPRVLVAGIGNVFFGDDGFGVSVARLLARQPWPESVVVRDVGIRGLHLAYDLLDAWDLLIAIDAVATGAAAGTLHVIEPSLHADVVLRARDAHGMDLGSILAMARSLGAQVPAVLVVGCDVVDVAEGMGLTPVVEAAVPEAARLVGSLVRSRFQSSVMSVSASVPEEVCP